MAEEVSPESKLYVKEEIEKSRKEIKEDLKKANSRATRTFASIALIVGLLGSVGIYGLFISALNDTTIKKIEANANSLYDNIVGYEKNANDILSKLESDHFNKKVLPLILLSQDGKTKTKFMEGMKLVQKEKLLKPNGYAQSGDIKWVWGKRTSTQSARGDRTQDEQFYFFSDSEESELNEYDFKYECFEVITDLAGEAHDKSRTGFRFRRHGDLDRKKEWPFTFLAIGY